MENFKRRKDTQRDYGVSSVTMWGLAGRYQILRRLGKGEGLS